MAVRRGFEDPGRSASKGDDPAAEGPRPAPLGGRGAAPSRIVIDAVAPCVAHGRFPAKRVVGEPVDVEAVVFADGHERLRVVVAWQAPGGAPMTVVPMEAVEPGLDRWRARMIPMQPGAGSFRVLAWIDRVGTWVDATRRKCEAGVDVAVELAEGAALVRGLADRAAAVAAAGSGAARPVTGTPASRGARGADVGPAPVPESGLATVDGRPADELVDELRRRAALIERDGWRGADDALVELSYEALPFEDATASVGHDVLVERERALFSAWYELFPRSWGPAPGVHGSLDDVLAQLGYVAELGFDILYLPPVHPIGLAYRKGRDNAEQATADDVGSPWAIGGTDGGHDAVHPRLGTVDDVRRLAAACGEHGMDLALDVALQCSPDHPWVREHPQWFRHRPDGSIHYAENPPKKYQDIYPLDFECDDWRALWSACRDVFLHWVACGVRVFRVDNPHTKPFAFWEWCLAEVRAVCPDVVVLSEAFTRPEPMHRLAALGFTQSYDYFPWRVTKAELTEYFEELSHPPSVDRLRPSSWPTTPDILPWHLQRAPRTMFAVRLALAALLTPSYGIYGPAFELGENTPADNGKEEYGASEKYELRWWDRSDPASLRALMGALNRARRDLSALRTLRTLRFHHADGDHLLAFSKTAHAGPDADPNRPADNTVLVVVNLDPDGPRAGCLGLDLAALGIDATRPYRAHDVLAGVTYDWSGADPYVELHPDRAVAHVLRLSQDPR